MRDRRSDDAAEAVDIRLFRAQLEVDVAESRRRDYRANSPGVAVGPIYAVNQLLIKDFAPKEKRCADAIARLRLIPAVVSEVKEKLRNPPRLWTEMALDDVEGALGFLEKDVIDMAGESARDATDLLPRSEGTFVLGREAFDFRLKTGLLLPLDSRELARLGDLEFEKTIRLLDECAAKIDAKRDWKAILDEMMKDHPSLPELLKTYRDEIAHARRFMIDHAIVGIPDEKLEVMETPAFERSTAPFAAYNGPAPLDSSRLGHFYVTPEPEAHIRSDIPGTVWHEAYPGHHLQFVYAKDVASLVRKLNDSPLLSEGWGFYCEELAHETGYYDDPKERLMQLNWRLQRAARIILDVGIHTGAFSYDQAVAFLVEKVRMGERQAKASVNAYTQSPTYFSCYMVGMLEIVRIREKLRGRLGARFTLKEFHERLLKVGNVPPALIEAELERTWQ